MSNIFPFIKMKDSRILTKPLFKVNEVENSSTLIKYRDIVGDNSDGFIKLLGIRPQIQTTRHNLDTFEEAIEFFSLSDVHKGV